MSRQCGESVVRVLAALLGVLALGVLGGCSLALDFDQCGSDDDCGAGQCMDGICQELEACESDDECDGEAICYEDRCQTMESCEKDADCADDQVCQRQVCQAPTGCSSDDECALGQRCEGEICQELERVSVVNFVDEDTTWTDDKIYVLEDLIFVQDGATLTIEPGTTIMGADNDSALVVEPGGRLEAVGTREEPIVFTSDEPVGRRRAGDWGGLALIGQARINRPNMDLRLGDEDGYDKVGGEQDDWNCGTLRYVRSEFGGGRINGEKALNGITFAGCGSQTTAEYIQAHLGDDDGIEIFGGTMDLKYAVSSRPQGDGFDLDVGWRGCGQFWAVQLDSKGDEALEIENRGEEPEAEPMTNPQIYNFTAIGNEPDGAVSADPNNRELERGAIFKAGGKGLISHGIIVGMERDAVHVEGAESAAHGEAGDLGVEQTLFYSIADGEDYFSMDDGAAQSDFSAEAYFSRSEAGNIFGQDPGFEHPYDLKNPSWVPSAEHTTGGGISSPPDDEDGFFDPLANYRGAFEPGEEDWTDGWTAYPAN